MIAAASQGQPADILEVISNLSSDEVFTPPQVANQMLDLLPSEVWSNPDLRWLDPGTKSGIFLREITKRLLDGLTPQIPDDNRRLSHILTEMVFGVAVTDLTAMMSRRSLYCSKDAAGERSVVTLSRSAGNVWFNPIKHAYVKGRCTECGASQSDEVEDGRNTHAYGFIHATAQTAIEEEIGMNFDVVVGNPPYQLEDQGAGSSAGPIYQHFVEAAKDLSPRHIVMITPSRWMAGGKGLDDFRKRMLADRHIRELVDYHDAAQLFPGINVNGGVSYFHWDQSYDGPCEFTAVHKWGRRDTTTRNLDEYDILVRLNEALPILEKVQSKNEPTFDRRVSPRKPFGLDTKFKGRNGKKPKGAIELNGNGSWVKRSDIPLRTDWIDQWKVLIPAASDGNEIFPLPVLTTPLVLSPGTACTETYLVIGPFDDDADQASNCASYMQTRFFRFLLSLRKPTQHNRIDRFSFIPDLDLTKSWTDELLYERYGISEKEQAYIAEVIREAPE